MAGDVSPMLARLAVALVLGALAGTAASAGCSSSSDAARSGVCSSDSDCTLYCGGGSCCQGTCPCGKAMTIAQRDEAREKMRRCDDKKVACQADLVGACDFDLRYKAVCRQSACVAEETAVATEHRAPTETRVEKADARCGDCTTYGGSFDCYHDAEWSCGKERPCSMSVPCDPGCCSDAKGKSGR